MQLVMKKSTFRFCLTAFLILVAMLFLIAYQAQAADIKLAWDGSTTPGWTKQFVYYGNAPRTYTNKIEIGTELTYTVTNLQDGTWYLAVTAGDDLGNESAYSNEVSKTLITYNPPGNATGEIVNPNQIVINNTGRGDVIINAGCPEENSEENSEEKPHMTLRIVDQEE